jgi:hypothetical protein
MGLQATSGICTPAHEEENETTNFGFGCLSPAITRSRTCARSRMCWYGVLPPVCSSYLGRRVGLNGHGRM